jgi:hypothetical protein
MTGAELEVTDRAQFDPEVVNNGRERSGAFPRERSEREVSTGASRTAYLGPNADLEAPSRMQSRVDRHSSDANNAIVVS